MKKDILVHFICGNSARFYWGWMRTLSTTSDSRFVKSLQGGRGTGPLLLADGVVLTVLFGSWSKSSC